MCTALEGLYLRCAFSYSRGAQIELTNTILKTMTYEIPYSGLSDRDVLAQRRDPLKSITPFDNWGKYPQLPEDIKTMTAQCWLRRPGERPSMKSIEERLAKLMLEDRT